MPLDHMEELAAAGIATANHESDLYVPDTPEAREILRRHGYGFTPFTNQAPPHVGEVWLDVPFAFLPWWQARTARVAPTMTTKA